MKNPRFSCPYFKHNPSKYGLNTANGSRYRACSGPGFQSVTRVKEHLYRSHLNLSQCSRCWRSFSNNSTLAEHVREDNCRTLPRPHSDEIDSQKLSILKSRSSDRMPEIDKWHEVYKLLFPDSPIPSPFYDETASSFDSFAIYMQTELPRLLEAELDSQISELNHLESSLKAKLVDVVRNCQTSLFQKWNSVEAPASRHDFPQINTSQIVGMRSYDHLEPSLENQPMDLLTSPLPTRLPTDRQTTESNLQTALTSSIADSSERSAPFISISDSSLIDSTSITDLNWSVLESPVHTDKRYRCYTCDATFTRFADKRRHEKKHQLFMISCTHCSRSFYRRDKFRDHCRKTHGLDSPVC